jgi:copper chaperone CopZ
MGKRSRIAVFLSAALMVGIGIPSSAVPTATATEKKGGHKLHRADFRVTGASCVGCLRRVGKILRNHKGVVKADVSIFKPHWAIVIFNSDEVTLDQLGDACKIEKVKFEEVEDKPISEVPLIVIPKGLSKEAAPAVAH